MGSFCLRLVQEQSLLLVQVSLQDDSTPQSNYYSQGISNPSFRLSGYSGGAVRLILAALNLSENAFTMRNVIYKLLLQR